MSIDNCRVTDAVRGRSVVDFVHCRRIKLWTGYQIVRCMISCCISVIQMIRLPLIERIMLCGIRVD